MNRLFFACCVFLASCAAKQVASDRPASTSDIQVHGKLFSSVYMQHAAEYRALCFQAYNAARLSLDNYFLVVRNVKKPAIVTDIDETLLDNSRYAVHQGLMGKDYDPESWYSWTSRAEADSIPGACSFLKYAKSAGVEIFYITNREEREREATLKNLQKFGFPDCDNNHLIMREKVSSKEERRKRVAENYDIALFLGDNLADFSDLFDKKPMSERNNNADAVRMMFGNRYIVIPNGTYGDWEGAMYKYNRFSAAQKDSVIRSVIKTY